MSHVFHHAIRDNGVLAFLAGGPLTVLTAFDMFSDAHGNTWASSSPEHERAMNKATGYTHSTVVSNRQVLARHGAIEPVSRDTIKLLYANANRKPRVNSTVWHITGTIRRCDNDQCRCFKLLPENTLPVYYLPEPDSDSDESADGENLSENQTSMEIGQEVNTSSTTQVSSTETQPTPTEHKASDPATPHMSEEAMLLSKEEKDGMFDRICSICGIDKKRMNPASVAKVRKGLIDVGWRLRDLEEYEAYRTRKNMPPLESMFWLQGEMAKNGWHGAAVPKPERQPRAEPNLDYLRKE